MYTRLKTYVGGTGHSYDHTRSVTQNFGGAQPKAAIKIFFEKIKNFQKFFKFFKIKIMKNIKKLLRIFDRKYRKTEEIF